ncbi:MAG: pyridoxamine 5'-phosphate oxidase family protein [Anaerolineae bacterium]
MTYHLRRSEKAISDRATLREILRGQKYLTLALCRDHEPYLVTMNYGFDVDANCFYLHCAGKGKKVDIWRVQPQVWGQVVEDHGYVVGACDHAYRTVQFRGYVSFVEDPDEKRRALALMIEQLEPHPAPVKARLLEPRRVAGVTVVRVDVETFSGKESGIEIET